MEDQKDLLIQTQAEVIVKLTKFTALNVGLVTKLVDALRLYMLDLSALGVGSPEAGKAIETFQGMHIVKPPSEGTEN
jgi:hypothetical protein